MPLNTAGLTAALQRARLETRVLAAALLDYTTEHGPCRCRWDPVTQQVMSTCPACLEIEQRQRAAMEIVRRVLDA